MNTSSLSAFTLGNIVGVLMILFHIKTSMWQTVWYKYSMASTYNQVAQKIYGEYKYDWVVIILILLLKMHFCKHPCWLKVIKEMEDQWFDATISKAYHLTFLSTRSCLKKTLKTNALFIKRMFLNIKHANNFDKINEITIQTTRKSIPDINTVNTKTQIIWKKLISR